MIPKLRFAPVGVIAFSMALLTVPSPAAAQECVPEAVAGAEQETFKDMPAGSTGYAEVTALANFGVDVSCWASPLLFCPSCPLTRAQLAVFIVGAGNYALVDPVMPTFSDVPTSAPYYQYVETAAQYGFISGCGPGIFCPDDPVTREQMAVFIGVAANLPTAEPTTPTFSDIDASSPFFRFIEGLALVCDQPGCTATTYCPTAVITRVEAAILTAHAFELVGFAECNAAPMSSGTGVDGGDAGPIGGSGGVLDASTGGTGTDGAPGGGGGTSGASGSGGQVSGAGGATGATAGTAGSRGTAEDAATERDAGPSESTRTKEGCSCRLAVTPSGSETRIGGVLFGLLALLHRGRRHASRG